MNKEKIICKVNFENRKEAIKIIKLNKPYSFCPKDDFIIEITTPLKGTLKFYANENDAKLAILFGELIRKYIMGKKWKPLGKKYLETRIWSLSKKSK